MYGCCLEAKHTQFACEDPHILQESNSHFFCETYTSLTFKQTKQKLFFLSSDPPL